MSQNSSHSSLQELTNVEMSENFHSLVAKQREFFLTGTTAKIEHRIAQLKKLRKLLVDESDTFCEAIYKDLRRKPEITKMVEISSVLSEIDHMIQNVAEWAAPRSVDKTFMTLLDTPKIYKEPKGVVLLIGPWNYPIWTVIGPLSNIIAAGNTVIIKPSEVSPHTSEVYERVFSKAFDKNYVAVVQGGVAETSELLKENFDHIMYTGNTAVGHIVMDAAAKHLTTVTLELGGKSPAIVLPDADVEVTARRLTWGKWVNCGQTCIAPDYILTTPAVKSRLVAAIVQAIRQFYGDDIQKSADYSRIVNARHFDRLASVLGKSTAEVLFQGGKLDADDLFVPPIILDAAADDISMKDEIFGPILPIVTVQNVDDAIQHIQERECPLALYLFTRDEPTVEKVLAKTRSGAVCVNDVILQSAAEGLHFGGVGKSGMGAYHGKFGFDQFSHEKPVLKRGFFLDGLAAARYPPITKEKVAQLTSMAAKGKVLPNFVWKIIGVLPYVLVGVALGYFSGRYWPASGSNSRFVFRH